MAQNMSSAVMAQRKEPHDSLDDFPTPAWGTRALVEHVLHSDALRSCTVWEPACNRGFMARPLAEYCDDVICSDVHDYGWEGQHFTADFLYPSTEPPKAVDWIITNPPFRLAQDFIELADRYATLGFAVLVRTAFLEGKKRYESLFRDNPPTVIAQFVERLPMVRGRCDAGASTATSYCWLIWKRGGAPQPFKWIPPCRKALERPGDYD